MNRTALVFSVILASLSSGFAVDITNTNIVGADGLPGDNGVLILKSDGVGPHYVSGSTLTGGNALSVTTNLSDSASVFGGAGLRARLIGIAPYDRNIFVDSSVLQGGLGGTVSIFDGLTDNVVASGGQGYATARGELHSTDSSFYGGEGGIVSSASGSFAVTVEGGAGIEVVKGSLSLTNVYAKGGHGGSATTSGTSSSSADGGSGVNLLETTIAHSVVGSELIGGAGGDADNGSGVATANGGAGLFASDVSGSLVISNSILFGGNGGKAIGSVQSTATGGAGLKLVDTADAIIIDATLTGGAGGTVNGAAGQDGASLEIQGSTVNLSGGQLIGDLLFSGAGTNTFSIHGTAIDGVIRQTGGIVNVDDWDAVHFQNTLISDGTMNFNKTLNLQDGYELTLGDSPTAVANFDSGLTTASGSTISGTYTQINGTEISGGNITSSSGVLNFGNGTEWIVDAGNTVVNSNDKFNLASVTGTGAIINNMSLQDITLIAPGGSAGWLGGVSALEVNGGILQATYAESSLDVALGVAGETSTEFGKAMAALSSILTPGSDGYNVVKDLANDAQAGEALMKNTYVRTTEMASTLVGLQSVISDQVKHRTRSKMYYDGVGYPSTSSPAGAAGWQPLRTFSDRMESKVSLDGIRTFSDRIENEYNYDKVKTWVHGVVPDVSMDATTGLPVDWQGWGRGYGSHVEQDNTAGFAGYEADIGGAMVGLDKRVDNMLVGIGGGYARTQLKGYANKDALADTGNVMAYFSTHGEKAYFDANASYAFNSVSTEYSTMGYKGDFNAHTLGLYIGAGYAISLMDRILFTPEASILNTLYNRESYTESSSLSGVPDLDYNSYDQWSHLAKVGATLSMIQKVDMYTWEMGLQPEVRAHWLHEFNAEMDNETYTLGGTTIGATPMAREEDLVTVGTGVRLTKWADDTTEIGLDIDGTFGTEGYDAFIVSGTFIHRF